MSIYYAEYFGACPMTGAEPCEWVTATLIATVLGELRAAAEETVLISEQYFV